MCHLTGPMGHNTASKYVTRDKNTSARHTAPFSYENKAKLIRCSLRSHCSVVKRSVTNALINAGKRENDAFNYMLNFRTYYNALCSTSIAFVVENANRLHCSVPRLNCYKCDIHTDQTKQLVNCLCKSKHLVSCFQKEPIKTW